MNDLHGIAINVVLASNLLGSCCVILHAEIFLNLLSSGLLKSFNFGESFTTGISVILLIMIVGSGFFVLLNVLIVFGLGVIVIVGMLGAVVFLVVKNL